ncbi:MAG: Ig-like domain-containing protein [Eubacterium sp.]|nr:Ig-like domain-containing protein [Eubacterium sp.]
MKKITSLLLTLCLIASLFTGVMTNNTDASAAGIIKEFPVKLTAPRNVTLTPYFSNEMETAKNLSFGMDDALLDYLKKNDAEKAEIAKAGGYNEYILSVDVDWAFDDPNGWHYNKYWEWENDKINFGNGYDYEGYYRLNVWDVVTNTESIRERAVNNLVMFFYDKANDKDPQWSGVDQAEYRAPGLKTLLDPASYSVESDETIRIDWTKHTIYARARWCLVGYKGTGSSTSRDLLFSAWSEPAAFGAATSSFAPYTQATMPVPAISNLRMTSENGGEYPDAYVDITVPDDVVKKSGEIISRGGSFALEAFAKVYGDPNWIPVQTNYIDIKSNTITAQLDGLIRADKPIAVNAPIEFRARFVSDQHDDLGQSLGTIKSDWSTTLTQNAESIATPSGVGSGTDAQSAYRYMTEALTGDGDAKGSKFGSICAKQGKVANGSIELKWKKVKKAAKYVVFGNKSGSAPFGVTGEATGTGISLSSVNGYDIIPGTSYKFALMAVGSNGKVIKTSKTIHVSAAGGSYTNPKSVKVYKKAGKKKVALKSSVSIKRGKTIAIGATVTKASKKAQIEKHFGVRYESGNAKVATITSSGKIKAKKKGKCAIYVFAQNGVYKKITLIVK